MCSGSTGCVVGARKRQGFRPNRVLRHGAIRSACSTKEHALPVGELAARTFLEFSWRTEQIPRILRCALWLPYMPQTHARNPSHLQRAAILSLGVLLAQLYLTPANSSAASQSVVDREVASLLAASDQSRAMGNIDEALQQAELAVTKIDAGVTPAIASVALTKLSHLKIARGKLVEAEGVSRKALRLVNESFGSGTRESAIASGNLAVILIARAHYIEASPLLDGAIKAYRSQAGPQNEHYADLLGAQAQLSLKKDRIKAAMQALKEELKIRQDLNASPDQLGRLYQNLAVVYEREGKAGKALEFINKAKRIWVDSLPDRHPARLYCAAELLVIYTKTRQYPAANALAPFLLSHAEAAFGPENPEVGVILSNIGMLYQRQQRHADAALLFSRAYQIDLKALGPFHPATALALGNYGAALTDLGRKDEGQALEAQAHAALGLVH